MRSECSPADCTLTNVPQDKLVEHGTEHLPLPRGDGQRLLEAIINGQELWFGVDDNLTQETHTHTS